MNYLGFFFILCHVLGQSKLPRETSEAHSELNQYQPSLESPTLWGGQGRPAAGRQPSWSKALEREGAARRTMGPARPSVTDEGVQQLLETPETEEGEENLTAERGVQR